MSQPENPSEDFPGHLPGNIPELEPQLEAAVWSVLAEPIALEAVARVKARAAAMQPELTLPTPLSKSILSRSLLMKSLTTVAGLVIVIGATLFWQTSPSAFGEVIKKLREARSYTYVNHVFIEGSSKPIETRIMVAEDGRQRREQSSGTISIMDPSSQIRLTLIAHTKTALVSEPVESLRGGPVPHPLEWLEHLKAHGDKPDRQLGKKMLGERSVEGFVAMQGQYAYTVWIDAKTRELVEVEHEMPVKGSTITKIVMSDFRFNEKLDESLFSYDVPEGYKAIKQKQPVLPKVVDGEKSIVAALRGFTKRSGGKFPKSISEWGEWAVLLSAGSKDGQLDDEVREVFGHLGSVLPFLVTLPKDDYQYLGSGKTVDDKRCIVFWYRNKESKLRAIYNDLSVAEVEEKEIW